MMSSVGVHSMAARPVTSDAVRRFVAGHDRRYHEGHLTTRPVGEENGDGGVGIDFFVLGGVAYTAVQCDVLEDGPAEISEQRPVLRILTEKIVCLEARRDPEEKVAKGMEPIVPFKSSV